MDLDRKLVPLLRLLTDAEQGDSRLGPAHRVPGIDAAEVRELHEMVRLAVDVRARVEEKAVPARRREDGSDGWPVHSGQWPEREERRGHDGPGRAGAHEGVRLALLVHLEPDDDGGCGLAPDHVCRWVRGRHPIRGVADREPVGNALVLRERRSNDVFVPDEHDLDVRLQLRQGLESTRDLGAGRVIRPHGVECYAHRHLPLPRPLDRRRGYRPTFGTTPASARNQSSSTSRTRSPL